MMIMKTTYSIFCTALITAMLTACGVKQYREPITCEDLELLPLADLPSSEVSSEQAQAISLYETLEGHWLVRLRCNDQEGLAAQLRITAIDPFDVQLYNEIEETTCDRLGTASFKAVFFDTVDPDLEDEEFGFSVELLRALPSDSGFLSPDVLIATTEQHASRASDVRSFRLEIRMDDEGVPFASKIGTMEPVTGSTGSVTWSQGELCVMDNWQRTGDADDEF